MKELSCLFIHASFYLDSLDNQQKSQHIFPTKVRIFLMS